MLDEVEDVRDGENIGELEFFIAHVVDIGVVNNETNNMNVFKTNLSQLS